MEFQSRPGYEPYFCSDSYRLTTRYGERGQQQTCVSRTLSKVDGGYCASGRNSGARDDGLVISARWQRDGRQIQCMGYPTARPNMRSEPHYVDVTIDGVGSQRVWY